MKSDKQEVSVENIGMVRNVLLDAESERDRWKARAEAAESRLARYEGVIKDVEDCPIEDLESCIEVNGQDLNPDPALDIIRAALRVRETKAKE